MSDTSKTLLPEGLRDLLPPEAAVEAEVIHTLTQSFGQLSLSSCKVLSKCC